MREGPTVTSTNLVCRRGRFASAKIGANCQVAYTLHETWQLPTSALSFAHSPVSQSVTSHRYSSIEIQTMASWLRLSIFSSNWCSAFSHASTSSILLHWARSLSTSMRRNAFAALYRHRGPIPMSASTVSLNSFYNLIASIHLAYFLWSLHPRKSPPIQTRFTRFPLDVFD